MLEDSESEEEDFLAKFRQKKAAFVAPKVEPKELTRAKTQFSEKKPAEAVFEELKRPEIQEEEKKIQIYSFELHEEASVQPIKNSASQLFGTETAPLESVLEEITAQSEHA